MINDRAKIDCPRTSIDLQGKEGKWNNSLRTDWNFLLQADRKRESEIQKFPRNKGNSEALGIDTHVNIYEQSKIGIWSLC